MPQRQSIHFNAFDVFDDESISVITRHCHYRSINRDKFSKVHENAGVQLQSVSCGAGVSANLN
jgi:hypothetical protein